MNKKKSKSLPYRDKKKSRIRQTTNFHSEDGIKKKYGSDIKVVSTNVVRENKEGEVKRESRENYTSIKQEEANKSNYGRAQNIKSTEVKRQSSVKRDIQSYKINQLAEKERCSKCDRLIDNMINSIYDKSKEEYYHFDCVLSEIKKDNLIKSNQRIVYLGSGAFGLVEDSNEYNSSKFTIKKKIQYIEIK